MRLSPTCQAITSSTSSSAERASPTASNNTLESASPATIHPRRVPMRSLSIPAAIFGKAGHHRTEERHLRQHRDILAALQFGNALRQQHGQQRDKGDRSARCGEREQGEEPAGLASRIWQGMRGQAWPGAGAVEERSTRRGSDFDHCAAFAFRSTRNQVFDRARQPFRQSVDRSR